jgi:hypothetical protein
MHKSVALSLVSFLALSMSLAACDLYGGDDDDDDCPDPYSSGSGYGNGSSGASPDAGGASSPACVESFEVELPVTPDAGDCQLVLGRTSDDGSQVGVYALTVSEMTLPVTCEVLEGPTFGTCTRTDSAVELASGSAGEVEALRAALGLDTFETSFTTVLSCARVVDPIVNVVSIGCAASTPAMPTTGATDGGATIDATPPDADAAPDAGEPPADLRRCIGDGCRRLGQ